MRLGFSVCIWRAYQLTIRTTRLGRKMCLVHPLLFIWPLLCGLINRVHAGIVDAVKQGKRRVIHAAVKAGVRGGLCARPKLMQSQH